MASANYGRIKEIQDLADFFQSLDDAGTKLVVVDFFAKGCGLSKIIAPFFSKLSERYQTAAVFLKVDVNKCCDVASQKGVTAMPTFQLYRSHNLLGQLKGIVKEELEQLITKHLGSEEDARPGPDGTVDLSLIFNKYHSECLNASENGSGYLESDTDAQVYKMVGPEKAPTTPSSLNENPPVYIFNASSNLQDLERLKQELENFLRLITTQDQVNQNRYYQFREKVENLFTFAKNLISQRHTKEEISIIKQIIFSCMECLAIVSENDVLNKLLHSKQEFITHNINLQKEWVRKFEQCKISLEKQITCTKLQHQIIANHFDQFASELETLAVLARQIQTSGPAHGLEELVIADPQNLELNISSNFQQIAAILESRLNQFRHLQHDHQLDLHHLATFHQELSDINL